MTLLSGRRDHLHARWRCLCVKPIPVFLRRGDVMTLNESPLGKQRQRNSLKPDPGPDAASRRVKEGNERARLHGFRGHHLRRHSVEKEFDPNQLQASRGDHDLDPAWRQRELVQHEGKLPGVQRIRNDGQRKLDDPLGVGAGRNLTGGGCG